MMIQKSREIAVFSGFFTYYPKISILRNIFSVSGNGKLVRKYLFFP